MADGKRLGIALGTVFAAASVICGILVYTVPGVSMKLLEYLTHSTWEYSIQPFDPMQFILGVLAWAVIGFVGGWVIAKLYGK